MDEQRDLVSWRSARTGMDDEGDIGFRVELTLHADERIVTFARAELRTLLGDLFAAVDDGYTFVVTHSYNDGQATHFGHVLVASESLFRVDADEFRNAIDNAFSRAQRAIQARYKLIEDAGSAWIKAVRRD